MAWVVSEKSSMLKNTSNSALFMNEIGKYFNVKKLYYRKKRKIRVYKIKKGLV